MGNKFNKNKNYLDFVFTQDGSVGLYNNEVNDIYHSKFGAKSEGWEKFILPLNFETNFLKNNDLKVLDICYGIGYNTKGLLKKLLTARYRGSVEIDILEYDINLIQVSPFVKDGYFSNLPIISYILLNKLYNNPNNQNLTIKFDDIKSIKSSIEPFYYKLIKKRGILGYTNTSPVKNNRFLHNIYYHYISQRIKKPYNHPKIGNITINTHCNDARNTIKQLKNTYDIVFLDAFTPTKLPTLWSIDFFERLYELMNNDGILVTYSNSAAVRNAMKKVGFYVGKIFDKKNRQSGTIASKNKSLIQHQLSEYDIGLMNTKAGIYFTDKNLTNSADDILKDYEERKNNSNLMSSSQYIKLAKQENFNE